MKENYKVQQMHIFRNKKQTNIVFKNLVFQMSLVQIRKVQ